MLGADGRPGATGQSADQCPTCGTVLKPGEGVAVAWEGRTVRFRCLGCLARFEADPARYLAGRTEPCRSDEWDEVAGHPEQRHA